VRATDVLELDSLAQKVIRFEAALAEDCPGAGTKGLTVPVELDLFGKRQLNIGCLIHAVQLVLGAPVSDDAFNETPGGCTRGSSCS
jgi:hypothetical protein